jgi:hypothetical protein
MTDSPVFRNPRAWNERYDTHIANRWVRENRFIPVAREEKEIPAYAQARRQLPEPIWEGHDSTIACYWRAWELAFGNLKQPDAGNDFARNYCDTAFNGNLFMWDSAFVTCFGIYGRRSFDFQGTLDTFYRKQHADGFICREISEQDGQDTFHRFDPSSTGPDILGWAEWNHFQKTGDHQRLERVFPPLVAYHQWLRAWHTWPDGSYWSTGWGCGMDNLPRVKDRDHENWGHGHLTWVDATFQAILSAKILLQMAAVLGRQDEVRDLRNEFDQLVEYANHNLWDEKIKFYFDCLPEGRLSPVKHIGAYWALLAGCIPQDRMSGFTAHLADPREFNRAHRIPALSADDPDYDGDYWRGAVWAPTNYMVLKGLDETGQSDLAHQIAMNHLENVVKVFELDDTRWEGAGQFRQFFHLEDLKYDDKHTLWENYAADVIRPGSHSKPGYVGWSGLPPIAVLFEDGFGLTPEAASDRLTWRVQLLEEHGVRRYPFGLHGIVDLICASRVSRLDRPSIDIHSNVPLSLQVIWEGGTDILKIEKES